MTKKYLRIADLLYKHKVGIITDEEARELAAWMDKSEYNRQIFDNLEANRSLSDDYDKHREVRRERVWDAIEKQIAPRHRTLFFKWTGIAASVLLLLTVSLFVYLKSDKKSDFPEEQKMAHVEPGTKKAILHLDTGEQILLTQYDGVVMEDSLTGKIEQISNSLVYRVDPNMKEKRCNVLEIPNGGEFQVTLSDSTQVWLNAGTKLTYPIAFVEDERRVRLEGEGYFEVKRDETKPFIVEVNGMEIKVLGTSFNLKSFTSDGRTIATLLSGKIEVKTLSRSVVLAPNQQADLLVDKNKMEVHNVDAEVYRAWTKGMFVFRRERLESILDDVARWYNVTIFYEQEVLKDILFSGMMERYVDISETLTMLEKTGKLSFTVDRQKITVRAK